MERVSQVSMLSQKSGLVVSLLDGAQEHEWVRGIGHGVLFSIGMRLSAANVIRGYNATVAIGHASWHITEAKSCVVAYCRGKVILKLQESGYLGGSKLAVCILWC